MGWEDDLKRKGGRGVAATLATFWCAPREWWESCDWEKTGREQELKRWTHTQSHWIAGVRFSSVRVELSHSTMNIS